MTYCAFSRYAPSGVWIVKVRTLPVVLSQFSYGEAGSRWELIMTGASIGTIPVLIVFAIFQRQIIRGVALTGLKG